MSLLQQRYQSHSMAELSKKFAWDNPMQVPRIVKITLNMGVGGAVCEKALLQQASDDMAVIGGQKAVATLARKSIAGFKIRDGWPIGCKVTLRGKKMWSFLDRLVLIAIPRIRDFRGLNPRSFDGRGSFTLGIKEQIIFPEINYDKIESIRGLDVCITTNAKKDEHALELLKTLQFPFR